MRAPPPLVVRTPITIQHWRLMTFAHWRYPADVVQPLLPEGLRVQTFDGAAWVGLLPFQVRGARSPGLPPLPWLSHFPETNVRTYVCGPDDGTGIYFLSLEAARLPVVVAARLSLGLPYCWSAARVRVRGRWLAYRGRRRWPGPRGAGYQERVRVGPAIPEEELGPLDHFLTNRYRAYSRVAGRFVVLEAQHPPWPLFRADLDDLRQDLLGAVGLPAPDSEPVLHASPGVRARVGVSPLRSPGRGSPAGAGRPAGSPGGEQRES